MIQIIESQPSLLPPKPPNPPSPPQQHKSKIMISIQLQPLSVPLLPLPLQFVANKSLIIDPPNRISLVSYVEVLVIVPIKIKSL